MDSKQKVAPLLLLVALMTLALQLAGHCSAQSTTDFTSGLAGGGMHLAAGGALVSSGDACDGCEPCICFPQTGSCVCTDDPSIFPMAPRNEPAGPVHPIPQADRVLEMPTGDDGRY